MTGSMYAAVAGLKTHMNALNVIGNNISNVNTYGYKAGRYTFNEALYTMVYSGSNGTEQLGGRNPAQIGYGCSLGTIDLDVSTKTFSATAQGLDCMIDGDGFFIVGDKTHLGINRQAELNGMQLTRLGNFEFKGGYMVDGNGQVVYGFLNTAEYDAAAPNYSTVLTPIRLPYYNNQSKEVYMPEVNTENEENPQVVDSQEAQELLNEQLGEPGTMVSIERLNVDTMTLDSTGCITCVTRDNIQVIIGYIAIGKVDSPNGVTHTDGRYYKALGGAGNVHLTTVGGAVMYPEVDADGNAIAPATDSPFLVIESAGDTELQTGGLEASGTDLADEISHMIVIQRGYQANTRIVTVTDSMLEELINMKR